jgi:U3 small nucleolar RNA-associated protein 3
LRLLTEKGDKNAVETNPSDESTDDRDNNLTRDELEAVKLYEAGRKRKADQVELEENSDDEGIFLHSFHPKSLRSTFTIEGEQDLEPNNSALTNEEDDDKRRSITYEMEKNKGLIPKRSKLQRNPRVKHRVKFAKAKVRRKGQVREVRKEIKKYGGEISGINARVKKGIKLA